ncbi:MAG: hypothetical protein ABI895_04085 [Deltaproteobacteria bacterium]
MKISELSMVSGIRRGLGMAWACLALTTDVAAQTASAPSAHAASSSAQSVAPSTTAAAAGTTLRATASSEPTGATATGAAPAPARPSPLNPTPAEFPSTTPAPSTPALDALLSRVAALRSRIAAIAGAMFSSKLRIEVRAEGESVRLESLHVSLDGGVVYTAPPRSGFEQAEIVYEHPVAPGQHVVSIEVERHDARDPQFSSWQESRFVVLVPEKKLLWTRFELEDESSMAEDFSADDEGQYQLRVKLVAEVNE